MSERPPGSFLSRLPAALVVFLLAFAVHVGVALDYRSDPFATLYVADALSYHQWALRIVEHGITAEAVFHQSPLFPVLLAGIYAVVTEANAAVWAVGFQILLSALAVTLLVPLGRTYFGSTRAGVAAAAVAVLHAPFLFYAVKLLPVSLALVTQAAALLVLGLARRRPSIVLSAACGALWGAACISRSEMLLFVPIAMFVLWASRRETGKIWTTLLTFLIALAVVIAPVTAHNTARGDFVLIAASGGENLFIGNQRAATGGYKALAPGAGDLFSQRTMARRLAEQAAGARLSASRISAYWRGRAIEEIRADPAGWLTLLARKVGRVLHPGDPSDIYSLAFERSRYLPSLHALPLGPWPLLMLAACGGWLARRRVECRAGPVAALAAIHLIVLLAFFVDSRLRVPFYFAITPFAGLAVHEGLRMWKRHERRGIVGALAGLVLAVSIAGAVLTRPGPGDAVRAAAVLSMQDRLDDSLSALGPFLARPTPDAYVLDQAGWVLQKQGAYAEASRHYLRALEGDLQPARATQTRTRLAMVLEKLDRFREASTQHDAAVGGGHANAGTFFERGMFRLRRGESRNAIDDFREAATLDPGWSAPRTALRSLGIDRD